MLRDLALAFRWTRRNPAFSSMAIATLAVAIAANAVVFALVKTVLLTPLPYASPDRLVVVAEGDGRDAASRISYATARDWMRRSHALESLSLYADSGIRPTVDGRVQQVRGQRVSGDFFDTLGVRMYLGRSFTPAEDTPNGANVAVLTHETWRDVFGGDPGVVGRSIPTRHGAYVVIGVLPRDFQPLHMTNPAELPRVFIPMGLDPEREEQSCRSCRGYRAVARLAPGVSAGSARGELSVIMRGLASEYPAAYASDAFARVEPLRDTIVGGFGKALWLLQAAVALLLVLACANVATLLLARTVARRRELAVRVALGAARGQLIRQMLAESLVVAAAGASLGVALAWTATATIARTGTTNIPRIGELAPDGGMLVFGIMAAIVTSVAFGLLPALLTSGGAVDSLGSGRTATTQRGSRRTLETLIGMEIALAVVVLFLVGLLGKSYWRLVQIDPGFDPVHAMTVSLLPDYPSRARNIAYFDAVVDRLRNMPGVERVGYASTLPFSHPSTTQLYVREQPVANPLDAPELDFYSISDGYLEGMRIPVLRGRSITAADTELSEPVALVSAAAAQTLFAGRDPIGLHIQIDEPDAKHPWARIVGIIGDVHQYALDRAATAAIYVPFVQSVRPQAYSSLVVRSSLPIAAASSAVRDAMVDVDPMQPVFHLQPMTTYLALSTTERTFTLSLMIVFGAIALALAGGGVYGVVSFVVAQRTREVGLRLALGARPAQVSWLIVRQILIVAIVGIAAGFALAAGFTQSLATLLFATSALDPATMIEVALVLLAAVLAASSIPGARAARIDPAIALRAE